MTSYFSINQPLLTYNLQSPTTPTSNNCKIIDNYFVYVKTANRSNILSIFDLEEAVGIRAQHPQSRKHDGLQQVQIEIPQNLIKLNNILHLSELKPHQKGKSQETQQTIEKKQKYIYIALISNTQICCIQLTIKSLLPLDKSNISPSKPSNNITHKILQSHYLLFEPQKSIINQPDTNNSNKNQLLLNIQLQTVYLYDGNYNCYKEILVVAGYTVGRNIVAIVYLAQWSQSQGQVLKFINRCDMEYPPPNFDKYQNNFTLTSPNSQSVYVYTYQIFNQKGQPLKIHRYNLSEALYPSSFSTCNLQAQKLSCHIGSLHNYFFIKCIHQQKDDIYICYSRYVPFLDKNKKKQNPNLENVQTHLWIYNLQKGYTKAIIDFGGAVLTLRVIDNKIFNKNEKIDRQIQKSIVFTLMNEDKSSLYEAGHKIPQNYTTLIVKMNSPMYKPLFQVQTKWQIPLVFSQNSQYFISYSDIQEIERSYKRKVLQLQSNNTHMSTYFINIYEKIEKKSIYCSMWQQLGRVGGDTFLQEILQML